MGQESLFIRLLILGQTLATFQLSGNVSLSVDGLIIFTIGEVISLATGLMNLKEKIHPGWFFVMSMFDM